MKMLSKVFIAVLPLVVMVGCGTAPKSSGTTAAETAGQAPPAATETVEAVDQGAVTTAMPEEMGFVGDPLDDPSSLLAKRVIYFDFDKSDVKSEFRDIIAAHAGYLADHPNASIVLEGHADERGSREYNMGLGERRANSVSRFLRVQGANGGQLEMVSYGEERPVAMGHDEASWRLNRRVEIIYQGR